MESSTTPSSSNPSTSSSILSDLTFPLGVLVGGLLAVGIQNGCRPYTLMNTQVCQPIKSFLTHASQQVDSHLVQWGLVDRNRPYYPTADYPELGVQQLYDPTILPLDEFLEEYQASADHIEDFQGRWKYRKASKACVFHDERCLLWRVEGKCFNETSPTNAIDFFEMTTKCCPACDSIDDVKYFTDCPIDPDTYNAFYAPGQVTETFLGMLQRVKAAGFSPIVHAAPDKNAVPAEYIADSDNVDSVKHGPWVVTIDDFVTNQEADALVDHGEKLKFERSMDGIVKEDGTSDLGYVSFRTSHETYCFANTDCVADPIVVNLMERITTALQMPLENCDYLQLLRYKKGQLYKEHQDYHTHQAMGAPGTLLLIIPCSLPPQSLIRFFLFQTSRCPCCNVVHVPWRRGKGRRNTISSYSLQGYTQKGSRLGLVQYFGS